MKPRFSHQTNRALTLVEVLVIIAVLVFLAVMLLPAGHGNKRSAPRVECAYNLKEIGLAYQLWAGDHNNRYPMQVSIADTNGGGTMEFAGGSNAWINFAVMSNELRTPKILWCPTDAGRIIATNFTTDFNNGKISYFVGLNADQDYPITFLSGDGNFAIGGIPIKSGLLELSTNIPISWTASRHKNAGNIGLADGSVQMLTQDGLRQNSSAGRPCHQPPRDSIGRAGSPLPAASVARHGQTQPRPNGAHGVTRPTTARFVSVKPRVIRVKLPA